MEVTFRPCRFEGGKTVAFADVVVTEGITVRGFRIVGGKNGLFATVPSRSSTVEGESRFYPQVTFSDAERRKQFLSELLETYCRWLENRDRTEAQGKTEVEGAPV